MLIDYFLHLRNPKLPVSIKEYLMLLEAIGKHVIGPSVDEFSNYGLPSFPQQPVVTSVTPSSLNNMTTSHFVVTGKRLDTVTSVVFGWHQITSQSPSQWQNGYFVRTSPTQLEVHPPQGLSDGTYALAIVNSAGGTQAPDIHLLAVVERSGEQLQHQFVAGNFTQLGQDVYWRRVVVDNHDLEILVLGVRQQGAHRLDHHAAPSSPNEV